MDCFHYDNPLPPGNPSECQTLMDAMMDAVGRERCARRVGITPAPLGRL